MDVTLKERLDAISTRINKHGRRNWDRACDLASELAKDFPERIEVWKQLHLAACLSEREVVASNAYKNVVRLGATEVDLGDMLREVILAQLRSGDVPFSAKEDIKSLVRKCGGDKNRHILVVAVWARWLAHFGHSQKALAAFALAEHRWEKLGTATNAQWRLNSRMHWARYLYEVGEYSKCREVAAMIRAAPGDDGAWKRWLYATGLLLRTMRS